MAHLLRLLKSERLPDRIKKIQSGDNEGRNQLIQDYEPFIVKAAATVINRYIESENSEEYLIGLEAFNEAINKYEEARGDFLKFATMVITCRLRDFCRKKMRYGREISLEQLEEGEEYAPDIAIETSDFTEALELKNELMEFKEKLSLFGISFHELVQECPKHRDTRENALKIARFINRSPLLKEQIYIKKRIPYSRIIKELNVSRKLLNRNHKFIIAAMVILDSKLEVIKEYINKPEGGDTCDI